MTRVGNFRYVRLGEIDTYHALGWMVVADLGTPHSFYAVLMWRCDCA
jgi:hypothetical protein